MKAKLVLEFYATVGVPLLYFFNLGIIYLNPNSWRLPGWLVLVGIGMSFIGLGLWFLSFFHLGKSFGVLPKKQKRVRRGMYKYLKHPMYVGIWLAFVGLSVANQSWQGLGFSLGVMTPFLFIRGWFEQKKLEK